MRLIRFVLGKIILFFDALFRPRPLARPAAEQAKVDAQTNNLALYHFMACPFCVKVRRHMTRRNLNIELRDVKRDKKFDRELVEQGGSFQVPCLRIRGDDSSVRWLYESSDIIAYLDQRFP
ncbi:MAG: glutathione S-transferase N-terminal domain-containing protein [Deltaproteobacteria bacterium]|nr:glutathione S-transferase N-terminal domain-containing protein [Deltaproteobacteria bacterium]